MCVALWKDLDERRRLVRKAAASTSIRAREFRSSVGFRAVVREARVRAVLQELADDVGHVHGRGDGEGAPARLRVQGLDGHGRARVEVLVEQRDRARRVVLVHELDEAVVEPGGFARLPVEVGRRRLVARVVHDLPRDVGPLLVADRLARDVVAVAHADAVDALAVRDGRGLVARRRRVVRGRVGPLRHVLRRVLRDLGHVGALAAPGVGAELRRRRVGRHARDQGAAAPRLAHGHAAERDAHQDEAAPASRER